MAIPSVIADAIQILDGHEPQGDRREVAGSADCTGGTPS